ncbi:MAG: hypothetical protein ACNA8W_00330 [Bradymonadaceae bacterium]
MNLHGPTILILPLALLLVLGCAGQMDEPPESLVGGDVHDESDAVHADIDHVFEDVGAVRDADVSEVIEPDSGDGQEDIVESEDDALVDAAEDIVEEPTGPFRLYLAPNGVDTRDGRTPQTAILTMGRVQEILTDENPGRDVEVLIAPGRYFGQTVEWRYTRPDHSITFSRLTPESDRPVFDGCLVENPTNLQTQCPGGTWFMLRHSNGERTNLVFNYIRVERYQTAISLNGARNAEETFNSHNRIFGCYFKDIGNGYADHVAPSTAVVRLVNSNDNQIENNHFVNVINTRSPALIHALYVAHLSHRNTIARNRFENHTGDAVRLRDYSNDNVITDNRFNKAGATAGYTDWYCDHDVRDDCTKVGPECPSWGNQFRDNTLNGNYQCNPLGTWHYFQGDSTTGCSPPSADARRVRTSGNVQTEPPCSGL